MTTRLIAILLLVLTGVSCDKMKDLAAKIATAMREKIATKGSTNMTAKVDEELQKLVDQNSDGTIFRKDLPFPSQLEVHTTCRQEMDVRFSESSIVGDQLEVRKGVQLTITRLKGTAQKVCYTLEQSSFTLPPPEQPEGAKKQQPAPVPQMAPLPKPVTFRKTGQTWQSDDPDDFYAIVLVKKLSPVFGQLLIENALAPRKMWFGKKRLKVGASIPVTADDLPMLLMGNAKGSFNLKLESFEPVEGHPCGVFAVTGDYRRTQAPDFGGKVIDEDVTIQSGKIWLSLIYPVILKEELDTIQTYKSGTPDGLVSRGQGAIKVSVTRAWKRLDP
jgi:hypothetical protein